MADVLTTGANEIAGHEYLAFTLGSEEYGCLLYTSDAADE